MGVFSDDGERIYAVAIVGDRGRMAWLCWGWLGMGWMSTV